MLSQRQQEIVTGSLLGDGCICKDFRSGRCRLQVIQSQSDHREYDKRSYLYWFAKEFCTFGCSVKPRKPKIFDPLSKINSTKGSYVFYTKCNKLWKEVEQKWYIPFEHRHFRRKKIVPQDIHLTPLSLCVWHMDDGCNCPKDANLTLATHCFSLSEVELLVNKLQDDLSIKAKPKVVYGQGPGKFQVYVGRQSYFDFMDMIRPYVEWDCFQYKTDTSAYHKKPHRGETHSLSLLTEEKVRTIFTLYDDGYLQKDIADRVGVKPSEISQIISGKRWQHLGLKREVVKKPQLDRNKIAAIFKLREKGCSQNDIARQLNTTQTTVSRVLKRGVPSQESN